MPGETQQFQTYVEEILDALAQHPEREAVVHEDQRITAAELRDLVYRMARALRARGLGRGSTVTLLSGNLPGTIAARYAANLLGCTINHLYNKLSVEVQAAIVRDVETTALVVDPRLAQRAADLVALAPISDVLVLGEAKVGDDLLALAADQSAEPLASLARPEDISSIRHTGGTTGHPKGICSTFAQGVAFRNALELSDAPERQLACTTLAHAAGHLADHTLAGNGTVVLLDDFDATEVLAAVERERITRVFVLPPLLYQLLDHPAAATADTSSLRNLFYGGCPASPTRLAEAVRRFGPVLFQAYGQNEAGAISTLSVEDHDPERPDRLRSAGKVLADVEVEIRDPEGRALPTGELGEICVRAASVMQGYWKQPELTAEVLRDGWLHTGDLGRLDAEGYLTVVDRLKDMIIVVGGHVYTTELEEVLNTHPQVLQSAVFGVPDADRMEQVHAVVVVAPGSTPDERELRELVRQERGAMYEPARITLTDALPLTDAGKPDKKLLRRQAEAAAS
ncbi:AMP-binding protein [Kitasatospora sp. LaBMicrA B282]|uniref:AMP-binding protein n=1 Tax=Kitasatospora sp. LaBMicrA B282 TaxID=3420949 RepID=UPI003D12E94A